MSKIEEDNDVKPPRGGVRGLVRNTVTAVTTPVKKTIDRTINVSRQTVVHVADTTGRFLNSTLDASLAIILVISASIFLYLLFYWSYMPADAHETSINLQFSPCPDSPSICSFPNASTRLQNNLLAGQRYSLSLLLELPDSSSNQQLGMFLSCLSLKNAAGNIVSHTCQSSMMRFKSELLRVIETIVLAPFLLLKSKSQRQWITVHYHHGFVDDIHNPAVSATVIIQSRFIQVYSSGLQVAADLSGLRHVMYHHSWVSGFLGISLHIALLASILLMSWSSLNKGRRAAVEIRRAALEGRRMAVENMVMEDGDTVEELVQEKIE